TDTAEGLQNRYAITAGRIAFKQVTFRYNLQSEKPNLDNISFEVKPATILAIIGGTGSGKSTLVQLIPRLYDVSEGAVLVDGIDVRNYQLQELRSQIAIVLQQNQLFSGTILENLKWGNEQATEEDIYAAAGIACADDFIRSFPSGYQTLLGQGGVNVSGGQKQRICIARALLKKPKILIMDDSTSAVDIDTDRKIREGLKNYLQNTTLLIIAQRISSVMHADQILVMEEGRIVGSGSHDVLLQTNTSYQEIYQSQHLQKEEA
ncbi:MAG: ABC transporter ATP-binding protein, partial [Sphingobacterium siyangense]